MKCNAMRYKKFQIAKNSSILLYPVFNSPAVLRNS